MMMIIIDGLRHDVITSPEKASEVTVHCTIVYT